MFDLTNFILNSSLSTERSINTQDTLEFEQPLELTDDSVDKDNLIIDPSSFVLLFAEILASAPAKSVINSNSNTPVSGTSILSASTEADPAKEADLTTKEDPTKPKELTNREDLVRTENQTSIINELPTSSDTPDVTIDTQVVNADHQKSTIPLMLDIPVNTGSKSAQLPLNSLENNVAMTWINSDNFQPPLPISATNESAEEFFPELEVLLAESKELSEIVLKKNAPPQNDYVRDTINGQSSINSKEAWPKNMQLTTTFSALDAGSTNLNQEPKIDNLSSENAQYIIQPNALANKENQIPAPIPEVKSLEIPVDLNNSQWANKFSEHIIWLGHQGIKSALIKIHPEDWGPLEISIKVVKDSASVNINTHNSHVRDIVDQALPKLREMMSEQGLNLSDVHIGSDANSRQFSHNSAPSEEVLIMSSDDEVQLTSLTKRGQEGIIDYFA